MTLYDVHHHLQDARWGDRQSEIMAAGGGYLTGIRLSEDMAAIDPRSFSTRLFGGPDPEEAEADSP